MEMNTMMSWDHKKPALINELTHGKDLVKQLKIHLDGLSSSSSSSSSSSTIEFLITKILTSFDKAILMMNWEKYSEQGHDNQLITGGTSAVMAMSSISPNSVISGSAGSSSYYNSDFIGEKSKRRKRLPRWTEKARVCMETGFEGPPDDGYDWRKYGQKDILAAKYPRSYYRCTHRSVQGCLANKQVQRSDEDPSVFNITYEGRHTCTQQSDLTLLQGHYSENNQRYYRKENQDQMAEQQKHKKAQEIIIDFQQIGSSEVVKIKEIDINEFTTATSSFSFPSKSSIDCWYENENNVFSSLTLDTNFMGGSFSPPFVSPRTSEPNFFSSTSNSPNFDLAVISFEPVDYQSHFLLDSPRIF